jgi:hypothetical protein
VDNSKEATADEAQQVWSWDLGTTLVGDGGQTTLFISMDFFSNNGFLSGISLMGGVGVIYCLIEGKSIQRKVIDDENLTYFIIRYRLYILLHILCAFVKFS